MPENGLEKFLQSSISFYVALIGGVISVAGFYFGLSTRIELMAQKLDYITNDNAKFEVRIDAVEKAISNVDKRGNSLEIKTAK